MTELLECRDCGRRTYYEKRRCPECGGAAFDAVPAGTGELLSVTTVHVTPDGVREPNALGLASFPGGANVIAQLDGELSIGDDVRLVGERALRVTEDGPLWGVRIVAAE
ncbi:OB-fold domain-containing protein [Halorubrum sp. CBA1229]|uniref:Zn-ribbon domain-containing OB-fold protein n=1 Tax=Halorubrum sp. CBA1229 TaxID=1853699 RepID=UPI000F418EC1|nr:OB-fold domain-containing protein [Halorubrum sp. CBA1229]QKY17346.1 OB-fold domain-containing protein [Halorubrum sp. CBA1229]